MNNLLIVDDEVITARTIRQGLRWEELGVGQAFTANSMKQACEIFREHRIDILLCDIEMPHGTGLELLEWVRAGNYETVALILTAHAVFEYSQRAIQLGCIEYILKPVNFEQLGKIVRRASEMANALRDSRLYCKYGLWVDGRRFVANRFWEDVLTEEIPPVKEKILGAARLRGDDFDCEGRHMMLLLGNGDQFHVPNWQPRDLKYAVCNIVADLLPENAAVFAVKTSSILCLIPEAKADGDAARYRQRCAELVRVIREKLSVGVYCCLCGFIAADEMSVYWRNMERMLADGAFQSSGQVGLFSNSDTKAIRLACDFIRQRIYEGDLSRETIARHVGLNPEYLSRAFKKEKGVRLVQYIQQEKIKMATQMLANGDISVSEAAARLSYSNFSYFSYLFKKYTGQAPSDYHQQFASPKNK
jgi:two-component system response regulator YesN